jgi:hypothetical protein
MLVRRIQYTVELVFFLILILLFPASAFACGDPAVILVAGAILLLQILLVTVILTARRHTLRMRLKYCCIYLLSVLVLWLTEYLFPGLGQQGLFYFYFLILGSVALACSLRVLLATKNKMKAGANASELRG